MNTRTIKRSLNHTTDNMLGSIGLQRRTHLLGPAFMLLIGGAVVGGVVALLSAPKSGESLREDIASRARTLGERARTVTRQLGEGVRAKRLRVEHQQSLETSYHS